MFVEVLFLLSAIIIIVLVVSLSLSLMSNKRAREAIFQARLSAEKTQLELESLSKLQVELQQRSKQSQSDYKESMKNEFKILADNTLTQIVEKLNKKKIDEFSEVTDGFSKNLIKYMENINRVERESIERNTRIEMEINKVAELGFELSKETRDLTRALKTDSKSQGAWGEVVLENMLQSLGFVRGTDYISQYSGTLPGGISKRPDFIIQLPNDRQVIIDSKVSLKAWESYVNSEDEDVAKKAIEEHCKSIEAHAKKLADKNYTHLENVNTVDFVLMFVPLESAYGAAMQHNPSLYMELSTDKSVKVVTGATIVAVLMLIKDIWKRELQSKNQLKLIEASGKLHNKIRLFLESFEEVGKSLRSANASFEKAYERLSTGQGNVIKKTLEIESLGAKITANLPQKYMANENNIEEE